jgi:hypothetical protein
LIDLFNFEYTISLWLSEIFSSSIFRSKVEELVKENEKKLESIKDDVVRMQQEFAKLQAESLKAPEDS